MGLALYNPADSLSSLTEGQRHFPVRRPARPKARLPGKGRFYHWAARVDAEGAPPLREHQLALLDAHRHRLNDGFGPHHSPAHNLVQLKTDTRRRRGWRSDASEGADIARCGAVGLPSDRRPRVGRPTSLERQEAFRDATTCKRRRSWDDVPADPADPGPAAALTEEAELYRLGLLYDDEHLRGEAFGFGVLVRQEPAYTLKVLPETHRGRRRRSEPEEHEGRWTAGRLRALAPAGLPLDLSFRALGDDEAIANFLIAPEVGELKAATLPVHTGSAVSHHNAHEDPDGPSGLASHNNNTNTNKYNNGNSNNGVLNSASVSVSSYPHNTRSLSYHDEDDREVPTALPDLIPDHNCNDWVDLKEDATPDEGGDKDEEDTKMEVEEDDDDGDDGWYRTFTVAD